MQIKSGVMNKVYISFNKEKSICKGSELGYLIPCKEMKKRDIPKANVPLLISILLAIIT